MRVARWATGIGLGAFVASGLLVAPALQAQDSHSSRASKRQVTANQGGIGTFTPAAADPKLAAMLARSGLPEGSFRFTPSESHRIAPNVTVAVRARTTRPTPEPDRANPAPAPVTLAPIAYNLGVSVGWKRFSISGDVTRVDLVSEPGSRERVDLGLSYKGKRVGGRIEAGAERPLITPGSPTALSDNPSYSIDVGGSYSLTRNLDVTAGLRYKAERDRLPRLTDQPRESQAVYVGTAFRF